MPTIGSTYGSASTALHGGRGPNFHPQVSGRSTQIETILALVRTGAGISLVPKMVPVPPEGGQVVFRSLEKPRPQRSIVALWPRLRPLSRAASETLKHLRPVK